MNGKTINKLVNCLKVGIFLGLLGSSALIILEGAYFGLSPKRFLFNRPLEYGLFLVYLIAILLLWGIIIGIGEGVLSWILFKIPSGKKRFNLPALLMALFCSLSLYAYEFSRNNVWAGLHHPTKNVLYLKFFGLASLICLPLIFLLYHLQKKRYLLIRQGRLERNRSFPQPVLLMILLGGVMAFLYRINAYFYPRQYPYIHNMFVVAIFWIGELFFVIVFSLSSRLWKSVFIRPIKIALVSLVCLFLIMTFVGLDRNQNVKRIVLMETPVLSKGICWIQRLFDFDRDGYSPILGGGDCNDRDPGINPSAFDIPGNEIDENCQGGDRPEPATSQPVSFPHPVSPDLNVIFVTADAARADHLSCYGYSRKTTPNIDLVAAEGTVFKRAFSQSSASVFSLSSLFTSLIPSELGRKPDAPTLAKILKKNGFVTSVITPKLPPIAASYRLNYYRDFNHIQINLPPAAKLEDITTPHLTQKAIEFIENHRSEKFFLWLYYYGSHAPYIPNPEVSEWGNNTIDLYDGELYRVDKWFGIFLKRLKELDLYQRSLIVVFGDHGEEFGEHGGRTHSTTLYNETIQPPLIIRCPGSETRAVDEMVGLIDIFPTVLDILNIEKPPDIEGRSLLPLIIGEDKYWLPQVIISETLDYKKRAIIEGDWKLIYDYRYCTFELYNLESDPGEEKNEFDREPEAASRMQAILFSKF